MSKPTTATAEQALDLLAEIVATKVASRLEAELNLRELAPPCFKPPPEIEDVPVVTAKQATVDDLRTVFLELGKRVGRDVQLQALEEFDIKKLGDLPQEQYGNFLATCNGLLAEAPK